MGYTKVLTYDGNGSTETQNKRQMYKITDEMIDLSAIVRVAAIAGTQTIEAGKDQLIIEEHGHGVQTVSVKYQGVTWPIILLYGGTWVLDDDGVYVSLIEVEQLEQKGFFEKYFPWARYFLWAGGGESQSGGEETLLLTSNGEILQDANGFNLIPKEGY
jgi:hypothetical protein